jgi:hypothetical protein
MDPDAVYTVRVVKNGAEFGRFTMNGAAPSVDFSDTPSTATRSYYRVEIHGPQTPYPEVPLSAILSGDMIALSNPIYFNFDPDF